MSAFGSKNFLGSQARMNGYEKEEDYGGPKPTRRGVAALAFAWGVILALYFLL